MDFSVKTNDVAKLASPCLVLGVYRGKTAALTTSGQRVDLVSDHQLTSFLERGDFSAEIGATQILYDIVGIKAERSIALIWRD